MTDSGNICVGDLEVCPHEHIVLAHGVEVPLSSREYEMFVMLAEHPGWVFSATQLSSEDDSAEYSPESVSVLVSRLRHKLAAAGAPDVIETVRGFGYRLHPEAPGVSEASPTVRESRALRDASWQLHEAVIEVEHSGGTEQQHAAVEVLEQARREVYAILAG